MAFIPAKCTQCGANITIDDSEDTGICEHCGTAFVSDKVVNNYIVNVKIDKKSSWGKNNEREKHYNELMYRGNEYLSQKDYESAEEVFSEVVQEYSDKFQGYKKLIIATTENFTYEYMFDSLNEELLCITKQMVNLVRDESAEECKLLAEKTKAYCDKTVLTTEANNLRLIIEGGPDVRVLSKVRNDVLGYAFLVFLPLFVCVLLTYIFAYTALVIIFLLLDILGGTIATFCVMMWKREIDSARKIDELRPEKYKQACNDLRKVEEELEKYKTGE